MPLLKKAARGRGLWAGLTVGMLLLAHPAPERGLEAGLEKEDPIVLPALCPAVQSRAPISLDLGLVPALHLRKGIVPVTPRAVPAPHPVPPLGPLPQCPAPLPGGEGTRIPPLVLARGVAPDRALNPLTGELSGVEAEDCTVRHTGLAMGKVQMLKR